MEFNALISRALSVRAQYVRFEEEHFGTAWTNQELALGFIGDVGDMAKLIVAQNGRREIPGAQEKLAHELADCLWSIIVLANANTIDLEDAFLTSMGEIEKRLK
jgi:NTP pyrophosphatase (non-canonical NTP hydrolase)